LLVPLRNFVDTPPEFVPNSPQARSPFRTLQYEQLRASTRQSSIRA
jgi:hypothetical protein